MHLRYIWTIIIILLLIIGGIAFFHSRTDTKNSTVRNDDLQSPDISIKEPNNMNITSPLFENNSSIPEKYTCDGQNINPPLKITDVPAEAKSLALILDDPDAPVSGGFVHWIVFNFDPKIAEIGEDSFPANATQGQNSAGQSRYTGPCPPSGTHRYFFKLFALDSPLSLNSSAKREDVLQAMNGHILAQTELIGLYKRP